MIYIEGSYYEISNPELVAARKSAISLYGLHVRQMGNIIRDSMWGRCTPTPPGSLPFFAATSSTATA